MSVVDLAAYLPDRNPAVPVPDFKSAMRSLAGAVSVITLGKGPSRTGFTATSVSSFSTEPPTLLVSLNMGSSSWAALRDEGAFAVNILAHDQAAVADRFAGRGGIKGNDRYVGWEWSRLETGTLGLDDAVAVIDCELDEAIERHTHAILLGRVRGVKVSPARQPLLYWSGAYQVLKPGQEGSGAR
jgi:flavin reductase (DIM6/NTAB) family NADH-FMN oxidoreductase RutF